MRTRTVQFTVQIDNTPEAVMAYIAGVRNRPFYLPWLKSVTDIQGDPAAAGTTWKWTWVVPGIEFEGLACCLASEPGRLYSLRSEGGIESTWTYRAEPAGSGTKLTLEAAYTVPERALPLIASESVIEGMERSAVDQATQNLKTILDR